MRVVADLHIHSKYSRATSNNMNLEGMSGGAKIKGINLLGTGDFTFKTWLDELKRKLEPVEGNLFKYNDVFFMLTTEVSTIFSFEGKTRKVHHLIHIPDFEIADQINESLSQCGNLKADGRPTLTVSAPELVEKIIGISNKVLITSAHAWTPWFSVFGSKSGFDRVEDCYQDQTKNIFSLETGLSSNPAMNWRLSALDKFTLLSNSDSHSPNSWRLGREANVFELKKLSFNEIYEVIKEKDKKRFLFTIEVPPHLGKYHFTGHRNCGISLSPSEAIKFNNVCPKCKRPLTIGVEQRVEELADRPEGFVPKDAIPFKTLISLYELISYALGIGQLYSKRVAEEQNKLLKLLGNELEILLDVPEEKLKETADEKIVEMIMKNREGKINVVPGYDGVYGRIARDDEKQVEFKSDQSSLRKFL
jgi:uncharacterized protein (TIGR00375 family)